MNDNQEYYSSDIGGEHTGNYIHYPTTADPSRPYLGINNHPDNNYHAQPQNPLYNPMPFNPLQGINNIHPNQPFLPGTVHVSDYLQYQPPHAQYSGGNIVTDSPMDMNYYGHNSSHSAQQLNYYNMPLPTSAYNPYNQGEMSYLQNNDMPNQMGQSVENYQSHQLYTDNVQEYTSQQAMYMNQENYTENEGEEQNLSTTDNMNNTLLLEEGWDEANLDIRQLEEMKISDNIVDQPNLNEENSNNQISSGNSLQANNNEENLNSPSSDVINKDNTMESYWIETRKWGENENEMAGTSKPELSTYTDDNDHVATDQQYIPNYKREDSTWNCPSVDDSLIKESDPLTLLTLEKETTSGVWQTCTMPQPPPPLSKESKDSFDEEATKPMHNSTALEMNQFKKAVGAERHKPETDVEISTLPPAYSLKNPLTIKADQQPSGGTNEMLDKPDMPPTTSSVASLNAKLSAFQSMPNNTTRPLRTTYVAHTSPNESETLRNIRNRINNPQVSSGQISANMKSTISSRVVASNVEATAAIPGKPHAVPSSSRRLAGRVLSPLTAAGGAPWRQPPQQQPSNLSHSRTVPVLATGANRRPEIDYQSQGYYQHPAQIQPQPAAAATVNAAYPWRHGGGGGGARRSITGGSDYEGRCPSRTSLSSEGGYPNSSGSRIPEVMQSDDIQRQFWEQYMAQSMRYPTYPQQQQQQPPQQPPQLAAAQMYQPGSAGHYDVGASVASVFYDQTIRQWEQFFEHLSGQSGISSEQKQSAEEAFRAAIQSYADFYQRYYTLVNPKPGRLTPKQFSSPHRVVNISQPGVMIQVPPHRPDEGQPAVVELQSLPSCEDERRLHTTFPGPLTREGTLKGEVRAFIRSRLIDLRQEMPLQWDSMCLMLNYLDSLVQENGHMEQNELAKLLMEGHEPRTEDMRPTTARFMHDGLSNDEDNRFASLPPSEPPSGRGSPQGGGGGVYNMSRPHSRAASVLSSVADQLVRSQNLARQTRGMSGGLAVGGIASLSMEQADRFLDQYRLLVMRNEKLQALEYACKHGLWGCAFSLASQLPNSSKVLPKVLSRFLSRAIQPSDPLQTLHHLLANQVPSFLRSGLTGPGANADWGDWRPHLAMILSAYAQQPQLALQCMNHLGDNLGAARVLYASQLCYLFAGSAFHFDFDSTFKSCSQSSGKVFLLGTDFHRRVIRQMGDELHSSIEGGPNQLQKPTVEFFEHFDPLLVKLATDEAIQLTEIYEYACSLKQKDFFLPHLVPFKLIYAIRLLDAGFVERAFRYCKVISIPLRRQPNIFPRSLFRRVLQLAEKLQFHPECAPVDNFDEDHSIIGGLWSNNESSLSSGNWIQHLRMTYEAAVQAPQNMPSLLENNAWEKQKEFRKEMEHSSMPPMISSTYVEPRQIINTPVPVSTPAPVPIPNYHRTEPSNEQQQHQQQQQRLQHEIVSSMSMASTEINSSYETHGMTFSPEPIVPVVPIVTNNEVHSVDQINSNILHSPKKDLGTIAPPPPIEMISPDQTGRINNYDYRNAAPPPPHATIMEQQTSPAPPSIPFSATNNKTSPINNVPMHSRQDVVHPVAPMPGRLMIPEEPPRDSPVPFQPDNNFFTPSGISSTQMENSLENENSFRPTENASYAGFDYFALTNSQTFNATSTTTDNEESVSENYTATRSRSQSHASSRSGHTISSTNPMPSTTTMGPPVSKMKHESDRGNAMMQEKSPRSNDASSAVDSGGAEKSEGSGWFRKIWPKKNNKEIHLPDDSKQTIKYDKVRQCWIDTSAPEDDTTVNAGPPPKPMNSGNTPSQAPASLVARSSRYVSIGAVAGSRVISSNANDAGVPLMRPPMPTIPVPPMIMQPSMGMGNPQLKGGMFMPNVNEHSPDSP